MANVYFSLLFSTANHQQSACQQLICSPEQQQQLKFTFAIAVMSTSDDDIRQAPPAPWARGMGNFMGNWLWLKEPSFGDDCSSDDEAEQYRDPWNYVPLAKTSGRKRAPSTMSERPKMQKARKQKPLTRTKSRQERGNQEEWRWSRGDTLCWNQVNTEEASVNTEGGGSGKSVLM